MFAGGGIRGWWRNQRRSQRGVALVITLIMLSIITFMAVTFLVLSQRERSSVSGDTDMKIARQASDTATARVCTELLSRMLLQTNFQNFDLLVSTNYVNYNGFDNNGLPANPTNVNYDYERGASHPAYGGGAIEWARNIANLLYNPRAPVFVVTNRGSGQSEFRYFLDLNRNGKDEPSGSWPVIVNNGGVGSYLGTNSAGQYVYISTNLPLNIPANTWLLSNSVAGDPEWIGVLERPEELHSADNRFIARYAYMVVPAGKALDINYAHNRSKRLSFTGEGFLRNQGVGTWEINLAAFLADLNTNVWWTNNYFYHSNNTQSIGLAFSDANDLLGYRYGAQGYPGLASLNVQIANPGTLPLNNVDFYSDGPLMLGTTPTNMAADAIAQPWSGADNTNHFFSMQDPFNTSKVGTSFPQNLLRLGTSNDTYNAYTYYRLMAQLGSDSPPSQNRLNVNFKNTSTNGVVIPGMETNLIAWSALDFFTNAADAMLRDLKLTNILDGQLISLTNIPVYSDPLLYGGTNISYYTPAVHRVLQLAANIYETMTNRFVGAGPTNYPSVFRPVFRSHNGIASIAGYTEVRGATLALTIPFLNASDFVRAEQPMNILVNLYGVPWVIGAKKGFPNFNEFSMENPLTVSRKLQFTNTQGNASAPWKTNQVFDFAVTNGFGLEAWNSYTNAYGRNLELIATNEMSISITNENGVQLLQATNQIFGVDTTLTSWPGWSGNLSDSSFIVPLANQQTYTNAIYNLIAPYVHPTDPAVWDATFVPRLWLNLQFKLRFVLIDKTANRIIDFVNLISVQPPVDIATLLNGGANGQQNNSFDEQWDTNSLHGIPWGIRNQIAASEGVITMSDWLGSRDPNLNVQMANFRNRLMNNLHDTNFFQAPYTPHRTIHQRISWQANDPLVHYTVPDLTSTNGAMYKYNSTDINDGVMTLTNLLSLNFAYQPWGGYHIPNGKPQQENPAYDFNVQVKDPAMQQSDNWDFPTNRLPNIGWLGRIHRGTPWQTVYMKPAPMNQDVWRQWANDNIVLPYATNVTILDGGFTHPTNDYRLFDLFTTALNENSARGGLNVNQTNLAAWSAVLGGVNVLTNTPAPVPMIIDPAGIYNAFNPSPMARIWQGINDTRNNTNPAVMMFPNQTFQHIGDVLATPQLTVSSPYLNTNGIINTRDPLAGGINDEVLERIPQQIMSLLTLNQMPRFVIYSFGQTLHPADHSLVTGGTLNGLCTNYQITAESATRAVVRVEGSPNPKDPSYPPHIVVEQFNVLGPD